MIAKNMEEKIAAINARVQSKNEEATNLLEYLRIQRQDALVSEELEEEDLKRQGIIIGQHIPSLPSKLDLNGNVLDEFSTFNSTLLVAKNLVEQNKTNFLRRTGNLPISDIAEARKAQNEKRKSETVPDMPNYLIRTSSSLVREDRVQDRYSETLASRTLAVTERRELEIAEGRQKKHKKKKNVLSAPERLANEEVLKSINHKLNYLRNPRNDPSGVTRMLTKSKAAFSNEKDGSITAGPSGSPDDLNEASGVMSSVNGGASSSVAGVSVSIGSPTKSSVGGGGGGAPSDATSAKSKYGKPEKIMNNPLFYADPSSVLFTNYDIGGSYSEVVSFRNVSAVTRSLRVLAPTDPAFSISPLRYPANCKGGMVAPGMSVSTTVHFRPNTLGDFMSEIRVDTESGSFSVRLAAQRDPPQLSIPSTLDVGYCLVGDAQRLSINCMNTGGGGRFKLIPQEVYDSMGLGEMDSIASALSILETYQGVQDEGNGRNSSFNTSCMRIPPFTLYPTEFSLMRNESVELTIEFVPLELRAYEQIFYMTCDNGQVRKFTLRGESKELNITISELNNVEFAFNDPAVFPDMSFPPACVGNEHAQNVMVVNDTGLPVEFEWIWLPLDTHNADLHSQGQRQIYEKGKLESYQHAMQLQQQVDGIEMVASNSDRLLQAEKSPPGSGDVQAVTAGPAGAPDAQSLTPASKKELLKSLHISMEGGVERGHTADAMENRAVGGPLDVFEVSPARGVLPGDGVEKFDIRYCPADLAHSNMRAVLMIKSVPRAALPTPTGSEQQEALDSLRTYGHGLYPKCRSWLEEMGLSAEVGEHVRINGALSTHKSLVNLQTLVHLVVSQAMPEELGVDPYEFRRMSKWIRQILHHVDTFRNLDNVSADENSTVDGGEGVGGASVASQNSSMNVSIDGVTMHLNMYDWSPHADEVEKPVHLPSLKVSRAIDPVPELHSDSSGEPGEGAAAEEEVDPRTLIPSLREFNPAQRTMMAEVWVDVQNATMLLGDAVCAVLDSKVLHEAVDYLKDCSLNHLAALQVAVYGEGKTQSLQLNPPRIEVGGTISIGKPWQGSFTLVNPTPTTAEVELDLSNLRVETVSLDNHTYEEALTSSSTANLLNQEELIQFTPEYDRVLIMAESEVTVRFGVAMNNVGKYRINVPLRPKSDFTTVDNLLICMEIGGPYLRCNVAEVDIGLVGVGGDGFKTISFTNESDVPAMFVMKPQLHVDMNAAGGGKSKGGDSSGAGGGEDGKSSRGSRASTHRGEESSGGGGSVTRRKSARGDLSRMSSARSDDFSVADSQATSNNDFKIELKNAVVTLEPPSGVVQPQENFSVKVICKGGKIPQRIRGLIESRVFDVTGKIEVMGQYLNLRGEVQSPKTKLYPMITSLGQVYVGQPVKFTFSVENMCNLPTNFKFLRPGGDSALYKLAYDKVKGPLEAKEKVDIECTFTSVATGMIDDIIACKIFGAQVPLAFVVKALSKGIQLEFYNLPEGCPVPKPLALPSLTQFPDGEKPPDPKPIEPLVIGDDVPLYQRRTVQFAIRNFSAIPAPFQLRAKTFAVVKEFKRWHTAQDDEEEEDMAAESMATGRTARDDLILAPHESGTDKFQSVAGKEYIGFTVQKQEDRKFLFSGLGASYFIDVMEGVLPPWGVQVVTIRAFNDIPGCYDDEIECTITEGTVTHTHNIPIQMSVVGCPIVIEKNTVGMTVLHKAADPALEGKQLLHLGHSCVHADPLVRPFYVKNHGSKNGKVKWKVKSLASKMNGPLKMSVQVGDDGKVKSVFKFWEDIAKDSPFQIEPDHATIPPYASQLFTVTLFRTHNLGKELAQLTGDVLFQDEIPPSRVGSVASNEDDAHSVPSVHSSAAGGVTLQGAPHHPPSSNKFTLSLLLEGTFMYPTIMMDRNKLIAPAPATAASPLFGVNMKAMATVLFAKGNKAADFCHKAITLVNPSDARLLFNVSTDGPFILKDAVVPGGVPVLPLSTMGGGGNVSVAASSAVVSAGDSGVNTSSSPTDRSVATKASTLGRTYNLLPNESCSFNIAFNPKRDLRDALLGQLGSDAGNPTEQRGKLILSYATGQSMHVPIVTQIATPFLSASSPRMYFGVCHTTHTCEGVLLLTNPTNVPARWQVAHVPGEGAWRRSTAIRVRGFSGGVPEVDDPSVFEITPNAGQVDGPTVSVTAAVAAPPVDVNRRLDTIVPQRTVKSSWATNTLSLKDSLELRHGNQHSSEADACYPMPLKIRFTPSKNVPYSSRFRFTCEFANSFDLVLQGQGTYEEHEHKPVNPTPK